MLNCDVGWEHRLCGTCDGESYRHSYGFAAGHVGVHGHSVGVVACHLVGVDVQGYTLALRRLDGCFGNRAKLHGVAELDVAVRYHKVFAAALVASTCQTKGRIDD